MFAKLLKLDKQDSPISAQTDRGPERTSASEDGNSGQIVQYLLIRKDLIDVDRWPLGALLAQASHWTEAIVRCLWALVQLCPSLWKMLGSHRSTNRRFEGRPNMCKLPSYARGPN
jgi:hypothetical protein